MSYQNSNDEEENPILSILVAQLGFYLLVIIGYINKLLFPPKVATEKERSGKNDFLDANESFYLNYIHRRVKDVTNVPICSVPGATVVVIDRVTRDFGWTLEFTQTTTECINLASYNYLGFAENHGSCTEKAIRGISEFGIATNSSRRELGKVELNEDKKISQ